MSVCKYCELEMTLADGCSESPIVIEGRSYAPIRFGDEPSYFEIRYRCGDCNVLPGRVHHHGCDTSVVRPVGTRRSDAVAFGPAKSISVTNGSRNSKSGFFSDLPMSRRREMFYNVSGHFPLNAESILELQAVEEHPRVDGTAIQPCCGVLGILGFVQRLSARDPLLI